MRDRVPCTRKCVFNRIASTFEEIGNAFSKEISEPIMPARIGVLEGIVFAIAIPIQTLRIRVIRHNRIRADEPANRGVVVAGVVVVQAGIVQPLAGEQLVGIKSAALGTGSAKREVFDGGYNIAVAGGGEGGAAKAVLMDKSQL
jgi:hypothetical protein